MSRERRPAASGTHPPRRGQTRRRRHAAEVRRRRRPRLPRAGRSRARAV